MSSPDISQGQKKICGIHQPQTFPWLGYFHKILESDVFVFLDNVQFKKNEWQNRNRILSNAGPQWLTVPVIHNFGQEVRDVRINNEVRWQHKHLQAIKTNYGQTSFFSDYYPALENLYQKPCNFLIDFNLATISIGLELLGIYTPTQIASEIADFTHIVSPDEKLITLCQKTGAAIYLSGSGGHDYLNPEKFEQAGIKVEFQEFRHPIYHQKIKPFVPFLSFLDLLFNEGPEALAILRGGHSQ